MRFEGLEPWASDGFEVRLTFTTVRELQLRQAGDFAWQAARTIDGWHFWPEGDRGRIELHAGDARARFTAEAVTFTTAPWAAEA